MHKSANFHTPLVPSKPNAPNWTYLWRRRWRAPAEGASEVGQLQAVAGRRLVTGFENELLLESRPRPKYAYSQHSCA